MWREPVGPVIVGVDGSPQSLDAVDLAAEEAVARVTPLVVVHVHAGRIRYGASACAPEWVGPLEAERQLLAVGVARALSEHPGLGVSAELLSGDPAEMLVARSRDASLLVLGHRRGGAWGLPASSVPARVLGRAEVPVIVHRPLETTGSAAQPRPVLVGVDVPDGREPVVRFAFAEAALRGAPLIFVYVWSRPAGHRPAGIHPEAYDFAQAREEAERMLAETVAGWSEKYPEVRMTRVVRHSLDVAGTLREMSLSAQLVVLGTSRHASLTRLLLGSVGQALTDHAGCPVAVVPAE